MRVGGDQCKSVMRQRNCSRGKSEVLPRYQHKWFIVLHWPYVNILIVSDPGLIVARRATQSDSEFKFPFFFSRVKLDPMPEVGRMLSAPGERALRC